MTNFLSKIKKISSSQLECDVVIVSFAKTKELQQVTERGIITLLESEDHIKFNVFVVESNKDVSYDEYNVVKTIYTDESFGYNKYLNLGIKEGKAEYVFLANNDLTYERGWANAIMIQMGLHPEIMSASPFCPQTQTREQYPNEIYYGHNIRQHINGWAIFCQRKLFGMIGGGLPTECSYWFSDNDYAMTLMKYNIPNILVCESIVNHHQYNHGATGQIVLQDSKLMDEYTNGQYEIFRKKWKI